MKKLNIPISISLFILVIITTQLQAWDRFSNETEEKIGGPYEFTPIGRYTLTVPSNKTYTIETKARSGDTYLYLWDRDNCIQVSKNDDGGSGLNSKITKYLRSGTYQIFIRSFTSNRTGLTDLYIDGVKVRSDITFGGYKKHLSHSDQSNETRYATKNVSSGAYTFMLLMDENYDLIGYDSYNSGRGSSVISTDKPKMVVIGATYPGKEGTCELWKTEDKNMEFLALCGYETRNAESGNQFKSTFSSNYWLFKRFTPTPTYYGAGMYQHVIQLNDWQFENSRMSNADGVDLLWVHTHGDPGELKDYNYKWFNLDEGHGSGNRTSSSYRARNSGDLEYAAFLSCKTVRIEHTGSWKWLKDRGWKTYRKSDGTIEKGFFDGVHLVVGYHSNHTNYTRGRRKSWVKTASKFAGKMRCGKGMWEAWKETNEEIDDDFSSWFTRRSPGMASSIKIYSQKDEGMLDFRSKDIKYGDSGYYFQVSWYGTGSTPSN